VTGNSLKVASIAIAEHNSRWQIAEFVSSCKLPEELFQLQFGEREFGPGLFALRDLLSLAISSCASLVAVFEWRLNVVRLTIASLSKTLRVREPPIFMITRSGIS
jgi:hypothetical protein